MIHHRWTRALGALLLTGGLFSCARTSPQPEITAGQRRCVIYHPYYYNSDKKPGEYALRAALTVQVGGGGGGGEKYTLRPYRSLAVPIPRGGTVVEVMDDPLERMGKTRRSESARIPAGGDAVYVRVSRTEGIVGMTMSPGMGIPVAVAGGSTDRATLVPPDIARKELADFE